MTLPKRVEHRQPRVRRDVASALRSAAAGLDVPTGRSRRTTTGEPDVDPELAPLRERMRNHPAHHASDRENLVRAAEQYLRIERDNADIQKKVNAATNSLARTFDRIVLLLTGRGFVEKTADGDLVVTDDGRLLARIYSESDLLVAECLRSGTWNGLDAAELAGVVSAVLFESRGDTPGASSVVEGATPGMRRALSQTRRSWAEIHAEEQQHRLQGEDAVAGVQHGVGRGQVLENARRPNPL
jgi:ATP-dependent RNA helicase HelY